MPRIYDISPPVGPASPVFPGDTAYQQHWSATLAPGCPVKVGGILSRQSFQPLLLTFPHRPCLRQRFQACQQFPLGLQFQRLDPFAQRRQWLILLCHDAPLHTHLS